MVLKTLVIVSLLWGLLNERGPKLLNRFLQAAGVRAREQCAREARFCDIKNFISPLVNGIKRRPERENEMQLFYLVRNKIFLLNVYLKCLR
jgi:hypothetical protein